MKHPKLLKAAMATTAALTTAGLYILKGRSGHPGLAPLKGWAYAHRGLHGEGIPENSMAAFRAALEHGYGIELDIHLMKDGNLAVIHDTSLKRTAGVDVKITDLTTEDLGAYTLEGTEETIPTFSQVLELFAGKAPMIIELKADGSNAAALCEAACQALADYEGPWCMESFDPRCLHWLRKHRPDIIRGQLTEDFFATINPPPIPGVLKFCLKHNLFNFLILPDFVSYKFTDRNHTLTNAVWRKIWDVQGVTWTLRSREEYDAAVKEGWIPIFEGFRP